MFRLEEPVREQPRTRVFFNRVLMTVEETKARSSDSK